MTIKTNATSSAASNAASSAASSAASNGISRRSFIAASAIAVAALAATSCTLENKVKATGESTTTAYRALDPELNPSVDGKWVPVICESGGSCGGKCLNKVFVVDGIVVRQKTDDVLPDGDGYFQNRACVRGRAFQQQTFGADRLKYPIKRKNWKPVTGGNRELRGVDSWERISWDAALTYISDEMKRVYSTYGGKSVFVSGWGGGDMGNVLSTLGGYYIVNSTESYGTWQFCHTAMGTTFVNNNADTETTNDRLDLPNADTIVLYGCNPAWASAGSPCYHFLKAKESGTRYISVGPDYNVTASMLDARWIPVRVGTDTAFLLGVAYEMLDKDATDNLIDWDFLHTYCVGFDDKSMPADAKLNENFKDYVLGVYDGIPKTPVWAAETGVPHISAAHTGVLGMPS